MPDKPQTEKKRIIKSFDNLDTDLKKLFEETYPDGYNEKVFRLTNSRNENFFVAPMETDDAIYLVKVQLAKKTNDDEDDGALDDSDDDSTEGTAQVKDEEDSDSYEEDYDLD